MKFWYGALSLAVCLSIVFVTYFSKEDLESLPVERDVRAFVGQSLIVGLPGPTLDRETKEFLRDIKPAGIIIYARNISDPEGLQTLISDAQALAKKENQPPYLVLLDEEPGGASRLNLFSNAFLDGSPDWESIDADLLFMRELGVSVLLAPLADFPFGGESFISDRLPARGEEALNAFNTEFITRGNRLGIATTLKHFPGLGFSKNDPHYSSVVLSVPPELFNRSLGLFKEGIDAGVPFVMTNHIMYEGVDTRPAVVSRKIVTDILEGELGFQGITVTDDLSDMPLGPNDMSRGGVAIDALLAGHTLVILSHNSNTIIDIRDQLIEKAYASTTFHTLLEHNYKKVSAYKLTDAR